MTLEQLAADNCAEQRIVPSRGVMTSQHGGDGSASGAEAAAQQTPANAFEALCAAPAQPEAAATMHHGGSFGNYMGLKVSKLREQFESNSLHATAKSDLFLGISIFVDGYTRPSAQELKQIMLLHGGRYENYLYREHVTHFICNNLPDTKLKQLAHERNPLPVVRPDWIVASLQAGRLLPIKDFQLLPMSTAPGQRKLVRFAQHAAHLPHAKDIYPQLQDQASHAPVQHTPAQHQHQQQLQHNQHQVQQHPQQHQGQQDAGATLPLPHQQGHEDLHTYQQQQQPGTAMPHPSGNSKQDGQALMLKQLVTSSGHDPPAPFGGFFPVPVAATTGTASQQQPGVWHSLVQETAATDQQPSWQAAAGPAAVQIAGQPQPYAPTEPVMQSHDAPSTPHQPQQQAQPQAQQHLQQQHEQQKQQEQQQQEQQQQVQQQQAHQQQQPSATGPPDPPFDESEMRAAQDLCAQLRSACDLLRGAPKSTWDNPKFMEDFFRSSRLHFIGTWKARIEALMADRDGAGPQPRQLAQPRGIGALFQPRHQAPEGTLPPPPSERAIIHVDMDCFFASVAEAAYPILKGKPLVVSHSASAQGRGEVSAANYAARACGVRATMPIGEARRLCPHLLVVPYMFDKYEDVSEQVYKTLLQYSGCVQPLSCDEAYLDVTGMGDPMELAAALRADIQAATGCAASAGIGPNLLMARLATRRAKPNGQHWVRGGQPSLDFLADMEVDALPGVGWAMRNKLRDMGITTVRQVWSASKEQLQRQLGTKTGLALWNHSHGRDDRLVEPPKARKSVGAEVNWGIRFTSAEDMHHFLSDLSNEVSQRMKAAGVKGKCFTLKIKRRQEGAPVPWKMLGHGACDNLSRSITLGGFTDTPADILRECLALAAALAVPAEDMRGVGIAVSKLSTDAFAQSARPNVAAPAKLAAPAASTYNPHHDYWGARDAPDPGQAAEGSGRRSPPGATAPPSPALQFPALPSPTHSTRPDPHQASHGGVLPFLTPGAQPSPPHSAHAPAATSVTKPRVAGGFCNQIHDGAAGNQSNTDLPLTRKRLFSAVRPDGTMPQAASHSTAQPHPPEVTFDVPSAAEPSVKRARTQAVTDERVSVEHASKRALGAGAVPTDDGIASHQQLPHTAAGSASDVTHTACEAVLVPSVSDARAALQSAHAAASAGSMPGHAGAYSAVPAAAEIDPGVLAELPEDVRRELRAVYGLAVPGLRPLPAALAASRRAGKAHSGHSGGSGSQARRVSSPPHRPAKRAAPQPTHSAGSPGGQVRSTSTTGTASHQHQRGADAFAAANTSTSRFAPDQVDLEVLAALPEDVRAEVLRSLMPGHSQTDARTAAGTSRSAAGGSTSAARRSALGGRGPGIGISGKAAAVAASATFPSSSASRGAVLQQTAAVPIPEVVPSPSDYPDTVENPEGAPQVMNDDTWHQQGRAEPAENQTATVALFVDENASHVLRGFKQMVEALLTRQAAMAEMPLEVQQMTAAACVPAVSGAGFEEQSLPVPVLEQQPRVLERGQEPAAATRLAEQRAVASQPGQQQGVQGSERDQSDLRDSSTHNRLLLGCEHLMQWVAGTPWDLELQGRVLAVLQHLGRRYPEFRRYAAECESIIQARAVQRYGVCLKPVGLLC